MKPRPLRLYHYPGFGFGAEECPVVTSARQ